MNWGFIGCGSVVEHKSGKPFDLAGESKVLAVMCRNIETAKSYAKRREVPYYFDDVNTMLSLDGIDAIYIATPPSTHKLYAKMAIEAGKAVYIEKPMGMNTAECLEILALAREKDVPVFVAFYRRGLEKFHDIKKLIANGEIGGVRCVNVLHYQKMGTGEYEWRRDPAIAGGGLFHDLGCHTLDILDFILGPIEEAYGFSANQRQVFSSDDIVTASMRFESGVLGTGTWCFDVDEDLEQVEITGDQGKVIFDVYGKSLTIVRNGVVEKREYTNPDFVQEPLIHNVIRTLKGEEKALSTGGSALRTAIVMDKILGIYTE
ncbi:MAG: Gfo/Idh/MocA family oxidoreductase [Lachnospiraceae bacterium]